MLAPALRDSRARNSVKLVPASAKIEKLRREATCSLAESSRYMVADLQSLGFGLPTSLMNPPRSLFRPETVGLMTIMISTGLGNGDGTGLRLVTEDGGAGEGESESEGEGEGEGEGKPGSDVVRSGVGKVGTRVGGCTIDVMVVTTPPGNGYPYCGVSKGAR